jgi:hypothetical protein
MKRTLNEQIQRIKTMMEQVSEPVNGKCDLTKLQGAGSDSREARLWDKEVAKQNKAEEKERIQQNKNFMSLSYDRDAFPLDKSVRKEYYAQYQQFMKENPSLLSSSDGFNSEQKYAIASKTVDFLRNVPRISYTVNLGTKFGLNSKSTVKDVHNVIEKMGGYDVYMEWFNAGGPKFK